MIKGVKEWYGDEARVFLLLRRKFESRLLEDGFDYYYGSLISKRTVYEDYEDILGKDFMNNLVKFQLNEKKEQGLIIAPEGTFRVYDFLQRKGMLKGKGKIFYSQECVRNESQEDIESGKTFSFWQTGFEIFGLEEIESGMLSLKTLMNCYNEIGLKDWWFRISDKRLLAGNLSNQTLEQRRKIYSLIDACKEDGKLFYDEFIAKGGSKEIAKIVSEMLLLEKEDISLKDLERFNVNEMTSQGIEFLGKIIGEMNQVCSKEQYKLIPFMPKSWDACNGLLFDAHVPDYEYAISGGGALYAFNEEQYIGKSGAGIGITRLAEYILQKELQEELFDEDSNAV